MRETKAGMPMWVTLTIIGGALIAVSMVTLAGVVGWVWWKGAKENVAAREIEEKAAVRKTFTREEVTKVWNWNNTGEKIQSKLGKPDATTEIRKPWRVGGMNGSSGFTTVVAYHYFNFSVDASGSGKTDSEVIIFVGDSTPPKFIP